MDTWMCWKIEVLGILEKSCILPFYFFIFLFFNVGTLENV
jgi:hypothetical protein